MIERSDMVAPATVLRDDLQQLGLRGSTDMIGASVGDAFKAIELCLCGLDYRTQKRRQLFMDHIEPCFKSLSDVHTDYLRSLYELKKRVDASDISDELKSLWKFYSTNTASCRDSIRAIAASWKDHSSKTVDAETLEFFDSVERYFRWLPPSSPSEPTPQLYGVIAMMLKRQEDVPASTFVWVCDNLEASLANRWKAVSAAYARARFALLQ